MGNGEKERAGKWKEGVKGVVWEVTCLIFFTSVMTQQQP